MGVTPERGVDGCHGEGLATPRLPQMRPWWRGLAAGRGGLVCPSDPVPYGSPFWGTFPEPQVRGCPLLPAFPACGAPGAPLGAGCISLVTAVPCSVHLDSRSHEQQQ